MKIWKHMDVATDVLVLKHDAVNSDIIDQVIIVLI